MLIYLLLFEVILAALIILTVCMVEQKYKEISISLGLYKNNRAYKTQEKIAFIENIIEKYQVCKLQSEDQVDLESMIKSALGKEQIGKFTYIGVRSIALNGKHMMWAIIGLELLIVLLNKLGASLLVVSVMGGSILLTIFIEMFLIIRALDEKKEALITDVEDYVRNTYPIESRPIQRNIRQVKRGKKILLSKHQYQKKNFYHHINEEDLDINLKEQENKENKSSKENNGRLTAQDIAELITIFK